MIRFPGSAEPGSHPHLYFGAGQLETLRGRTRHPRFARDWAAVYVQAEQELSLPIFHEPDGFKIQKFAAYRAGRFAFVYTITGEARFGQRAQEILDAFVAAPSWMNAQGIPFSLNQGGICRGLALAYDLMVGEMSAEKKAAFVAACMGKAVGPFLQDCWSEKNKYLNGHRTQNHLAAYAAGAGCLFLALNGDGVELSREIEIARAHTLRFLDWYDESGGAIEIGGYFGAANEHLLKFFLALERKGFESIFFQRAKKLQRYLYPQMFMSLGGTFAANFSDSEHGPFNAAYRNIALLLAAKFRDPVLQWWAGKLADGDEMAPICGDPELAECPPEGFPESCVFPACGVGVLRSSMTDAGTLFLGLKGGRAKGTAFDASHCQLDLNTVVLEAYGARLLADHGYDHDYIETRHHNSLVVDGVGQAEEQNPYAELQDLSPTDNVAYIASRIETGYGPRLQKFDRHAYLVAKSVFVLVDDVQLNAPGVLSWNFHVPEGAEIMVAGDEARVRNGGVDLRVIPFGDTAVKFEKKTDHRLARIEATSRQAVAQATVGWILAPTAVGVDLGAVTAELAEGRVRLRWGNRERVLPVVQRRVGFVSGVMLAPPVRHIGDKFARPEG